MTSSSAAEQRTVAVTAFGIEVHIQISGARSDELTEHVLTVWDWCGAELVANDEAALTVDVVLDDEHDIRVVSDRLTPAVTLAAIGAAQGELLMLHAGAVADPATGRTVVFVGPSGAGKSTASRKLSRHFGYVTDETVAVTRSLEVLAYPKPVSLIPEGPRWGKEQHSPADLGLLRAPNSLRPAGLLFLDRQQAQTPPVLAEVPTGEALAHLGEQTSFLGSLDRPLHFLADLVHAAGGAHTVTYSDADDLVAVVRGLLADETRPLPETEPPQPTLAEAYADDIPPRAAEDLPIRRRSFTDFHIEEEVGTVMVDDRVTVLSHMATRILTLLGDDTATARPLADALLAEFGDPGPDAGDPVLLVDALIADLVDAGVVERV